MKRQTRPQKRKPAASERTARKPFRVPLPAAAAIFLATTLVFFRAHIFGGAYFWEDFTEYVYPIQSFAARALRAGELPFWNPYTFSGAPFLADVAVGFFYPPNWLLALFVRGDALPVFAPQALIVAHYWLAQLTMFLLARRLKASDGASLVAAVSYGFSGIMTCHTFHPMMIAHFAWFPLVFAHFYAAITERSLKSSLAAGVTFGVMALAGHPQTTLYLGLLLGFAALWIIAVRLARKTFSAREAAAALALGVLPAVVGAGIFAVQLFHSQEFSANSERNALTLEKASIGSMQLRQTFTAVAPRAFGSAEARSTNVSDKRLMPFTLEGSDYYAFWETAFYFGIPALLLGLIGLARSFRDAERDFLGMMAFAAAAFAILFALGGNGFVFPIFFQLPLFDRFRVPSRIVMYLPFLFALLAAVGFDALWRDGKSLGRALYVSAGGVALAALLLAVGALGGILETPQEFASEIQQYGVAALVVALVSGATLAALARGRLAPATASALLAVIAFTDLYLAWSSFNKSDVNPQKFYELPSELSTLAARPPDTLFRVQTQGKRYMLMPRNQGLITPVMMFEGYMPLLLDRRLPPAPAWETTLNLLNVRYAVDVDPSRGAPFLRERPTAFPQARMAYKAAISTPDNVKALATSGTIDFANEVILEKPIALQLSGASAATVRHSVKCLKYGANEIEYAVSTAENGILALSEIWYPAWQASIDGQPAEALRVNYSLRGVAVPAGERRVRVFYSSLAFQAGAWTSALTTLLAVGAWTLLKARESRRKREQASATNGD